MSFGVGFYYCPLGLPNWERIPSRRAHLTNHKNIVAMTGARVPGKGLSRPGPLGDRMQCLMHPFFPDLFMNAFTWDLL